MTSITSEKAMDLSIKMLERSDAYWTKAAVFATAAIAIKGLGVKIGKLAEVVDLKEVPGEVVVGILALVALFNVALAGVWGWQGSAARFAPEEFKSTMARTGADLLLPLVMAILAAIVLVIIVRRDVCVGSWCFGSIFRSEPQHLRATPHQDARCKAEDAKGYERCERWTSQTDAPPKQPH